MSWALSSSNDASSICPDGLTLGPRDIFAASPEGQRGEAESDAEYTQRLRTGGQAVLTAPNGQNLCMNPEAGAPDPHHHIVRADIPVFGIDLDGLKSNIDSSPVKGTCAHDDFDGVNGVGGIDNQFFRAIGCTNTFAPGGQANDFGSSGMLVGEWGILITLEDVQDLHNDSNVVVHLYANNDPVQLSPNREPLWHATYAIDQDPRYQAKTRGSIVDGILTTDPVDARFHFVLNSIRLDRPLWDARLHMTINDDGSMEGIMAGYSPVEEIYDTVFGFRNGRDGSGQLAPLRRRQGSSSGYAATARHTCNGVYFALQQMADGHRESETGRCGSISTQYRIGAIPAFVVNTETQSINADLVQ